MPIMTQLIHLNRFELISKIQSIDRENQRLKTSLMKSQLLTHFYHNLYENCLHLSENHNNNEIKSRLKSMKTKLLNQIQCVLKCDKTVEISLTKLQTEDTLRSHSFIEKSTQYELNDSLSEDKDMNCVQNDCQSMANCIEIDLNVDSSHSSSDKKSDDVFSTDDSQTNFTSIEVNIKKKSDESNGKIKTKQKEKRVEKFVCLSCGKSYKVKKSLDNHIILTHEYKRTKDDIKVEPQLSNGVKIEPKTSDTIVCQWPDCRLTFKNRTHFLRHYSIHKESRKLCTDCGLRFEDSNQLREHLLWHSNHQYLNGSQSHPNQCPMDSMEPNKHFSCHISNCKYKTSNHHNLDVHQYRAHDMIYTSL